MANRLYKSSHVLEAGVVKLFGNFTTSTSGTVASSSCKGFSIAKTAAETGRYTVTLADTYYAFLGCAVTIVSSADTAYTNAKGLASVVRNISINDSTPTFNIQFSDPESGADAELEDSAVVYLEITLKNSSVY